VHGHAGHPAAVHGNIVGHVQGVADMGSLASWTADQFDPTLNWKDVEWIKQRWGGKLILKGIMDAEDARLAAETGADALIVSNHGGRQLDGAPATIDALPSIVQAAGRDIEVWLDSGIRSGQDVLKARALGAQGTLIGRSFLYGLGAYGQDGVTRALQIIQKELDTTMAFCGHTTSAASARTSCCRAPTRCRFCRSDTAACCGRAGIAGFLSISGFCRQMRAISHGVAFRCAEVSYILGLVHVPRVGLLLPRWWLVPPIQRSATCWIP
jgi:hypothetical protein